MKIYTRWFGAALIGAALMMTMKMSPAEAYANSGAPDGPLGQTRQAIINGDLVGMQTQKDLGLITLGNRCSGTLVNRSWVLTATHCITTDGQPTGPTAALATDAITATWTSRTAIPTRVIRNVGGLDVALLFLGGGDLGAARIQLFYVEQVEKNQTIMQYGRGISRYAFHSATVDVQSFSDGQYRSAWFTSSDTGEDFITVQPNSVGQIGAGGDSGGPSIVIGPGGVNLGIAGVFNSCHTDNLEGHETATGWTWVKNIRDCTSAGLARIRFDIVNIISERPIASNDFNDDNLPDITWHNDVTGETQIWFMNGSSRIGRATVVDEAGRAILIGLPWRIVASRDFNRDNQTDILWYNNATGELQVWFMAGFRIRSRATVLGENGSPTFIGLPWSVVGANDMDGDQYADIVWHNASTGETQLWLMNGTRVARRATVLAENGTPLLVGLPWTIVSTDDMNNDGKPDIIWHNAASGETQYWHMNTNRVLQRATVFTENSAGPAFVGAPWYIMGTNDFDRDNNTDILWHNDSTGETQIWFMNGRTIKSRATVNAVADGGGAFVGVPWHIMPH